MCILKKFGYFEYLFYLFVHILYSAIGDRAYFSNVSIDSEFIFSDYVAFPKIKPWHSLGNTKKEMCKPFSY